MTVYYKVSTIGSGNFTHQKRLPLARPGILLPCKYTEVQSGNYSCSSCGSSAVVDVVARACSALSASWVRDYRKYSYWLEANPSGENYRITWISSSKLLQQKQTFKAIWLLECDLVSLTIFINFTTSLYHSNPLRLKSN